MENIEIERGKALIQLAQITMIFSGFLLATAGIAYTNSVNTLPNSLKLLNNHYSELIRMKELNITSEEKEPLIDLIELSTSYSNSINPQLELAKFSFYFGGTMAFVSFVIWSLGYWKINRIEKNKNF